MKILFCTGVDVNAGKSTLVRHLFRPKLAEHFKGGVQYYSVEDDGRISTGEDRKFDSKDIVAISTELDVFDITTDGDSALLLEIGGQRFERFLAESARLETGSFEFDKVIYPIGPAFKAEESLKSIFKLMNCGIKGDSIYVVFNQVDLMSVQDGSFKQSLETVHAPFLANLKKFGVHVCSTPVYRADVFEELRLLEGEEHAAGTLAALPKNHFLEKYAAARKAGNGELASAFMHMHGTQKRCKGLQGTFDAVFEFVFPELALRAAA